MWDTVDNHILLLSSDKAVIQQLAEQALQAFDYGAGMEEHDESDGDEAGDGEDDEDDDSGYGYGTYGNTMWWYYK